MTKLGAGISAMIMAISVAVMVQADDTELYVNGGGVAEPSQPQVLIIFDTSGSMDTEQVDGPALYDKDFDYSGSNNQRVYYMSPSELDDFSAYPDPADPSENRYFYAENNACASSKSALAGASGFYITQARIFAQGANYSSEPTQFWRPVPAAGISRNRETLLLDCLSDLSAHEVGNAPSAALGLNGQGFPRNIDSDTPYDGTEESAADAVKEANSNAAAADIAFGSSDKLVLLSHNFLAFVHSNTGTVVRTRAAIAKSVITTLVESTPDVEFGLAMFNRNRNEVGDDDDGARILHGIRDMSIGSNRTDLVSTLNSLPANGWTPLCESLYEAYRYFSGGEVWNGNNTVLSGQPLRDASIIAGGNYVTPMKACQQQAYVILITDGLPTNDENRNDEMQAELGLLAEDREGNNYLPAVAQYMHDNDLNSSLAGQQRVATYTIGFSADANEAETVLTKAANLGGGLYFSAQNSHQLQDVLTQIFTNILTVDATFSSPSISANSFDRTRTNNALYFGMFLPSDTPRWAGNLKKLTLDSSANVVDSNGEKAIDANGNIDSSACTVWTPTTVCNASSGGDGNDVLVGGVAATLQSASRKVLTDPASYRETTFAATALPLLTKASLIAAINTVATPATEATLRGVEHLNVAADADVMAYVNWLLGDDVDDEDQDNSRVDKRSALFGDPLHSKPLAIDYGNSGGSGKGVRIIVGTNHGYLHMFEDKGTTVEESWAYYLTDMLPTLDPLRRNEALGGHSVYGLDGSAVAYINKLSGGENIDPSLDRVWIYFGLRRGGSQYYGLDITNPDAPKLMWRVSANTPNMEELGQTWAEPTVTMIPGYDKPVVIVGGGYDSNKDTRAIGMADSRGRAIYILDAENGTLLHRFVHGVLAASATATPFPAVDAIPNGITPLDSDGDGVTDRLYAADTGGNVWRIDMPSAIRTDWGVSHFAALGFDRTASTPSDDVSNDRRFFAEVSVAQTSFELKRSVGIAGTELITAAEYPYDSVLIGSGNRPHPNGTGIQNHLFALRDSNVSAQIWSSENPAPAPITMDDLYSVDNDPFSDSLDLADADAVQQRLEFELDFSAARGWRYTLAPSEKSLSAPTIIAGQAYFTTFTPGDLTAAEGCVSNGQGKLYRFGLQNAANPYVINVGARLPDTPQVVIPPKPEGVGADWNPQISLVGVGPGESESGTLATGFELKPSRTYYRMGGE